MAGLCALHALQGWNLGIGWDAVPSPFPPPPRPTGITAPPVPLMLGGGAGIVAITCLIITQYPGHLYHRPDYPALALFSLPFLWWALKAWRERRILKLGDACTGFVTGVGVAPLRYRLLMLLPRNIKYISFAFQDGSGDRHAGGRLDWWSERAAGDAVYIFFDPRHPRRAVVHGCCMFRVKGLGDCPAVGERPEA